MTGLPEQSVAAAVAAVRARTPLVPRVAIILGTGLGGLGRELAGAARIPYPALPGFPVSTVESHAGALLLGHLGATPVVAMHGRVHLYEGYDAARIGFPVRVLHALGARTLVVSNACGGMHPLWRRGDLVLLADHLNLLFANPLVGALRGPGRPDDGDGAPPTVFTDLSAAYDPGLRALAREVALGLGIPLREGTYAAVTGPCLETRAEYRMLRTMGADVVGMSTVPEVTMAAHLGMRVLGCSIITDLCLPDALEEADLATIIAVAEAAEPALTALVRGVVARLG